MPSPFPPDAKITWGRTDQGIDGQSDPGTVAVAVASGTVGYQCDPGGFGCPYVVLHLDQPIDPGCGSQDTIYYGHLFPTAAPGSHVNAGDPVARSGATGGGNASGERGGFELGFMRNGSPAPNTGDCAKSYFQGGSATAVSSSGGGDKYTPGSIPNLSDPAQVAQWLWYSLFGSVDPAQFAIRPLEVVGGALLIGVGLVGVAAVIATGKGRDLGPVAGGAYLYRRGRRAGQRTTQMTGRSARGARPKPVTPAQHRDTMRSASAADRRLRRQRETAEATQEYADYQARGGARATGTIRAPGELARERGQR